jgi:hypothetical protein
MTAQYRAGLMAAALMFMVAGGSGRADEPPATIRAETAAVVIGIDIDPVLLAVPKLADRLRREAKTSVATWTAEGAAELKSSPDQFRDGRRWSFEQSYRAVFTSDRWVSVAITTDAYTGGAHGTTLLDSINWDLTRGRDFGIEDLLTETRNGGPALTALVRGLRRAVLAEKKARDVAADGAAAALATALPAQVGDLPPFTLEPSTEAGKAAGLRFHIEPYVVGAYAEGSYSVVVPLRDFAAHLKPALRGLFGGEPASR